MIRGMLIIIFGIVMLFAEPATKEDIKELKSDIKLILNKLDDLNKKVNEIDKKVYANSVKIDMLEKIMNKRFEDMNKRFEDMNKRFEQMNESFNKRFEQIDKRFEDMNKRFEDMISYLWMISAAFLGIAASAIGFAIWDRKSTIKAAKEEIIEDIKTNRLKDFILELQKLAKKDTELAKVLRSFHLM